MLRRREARRSIPPSLLIVLLAIVGSLSHALALSSSKKYKPCFERYNGHKLVGVQPFHNEWRIPSEEQCLEFCMNTASRCASIVFDRVKHICHYFSMKAFEEQSGIVRHKKFVYLQRHSPGGNNCSANEPKTVGEEQQILGEREGSRAEAEQANSTTEANSMVAIFERMGDELKEHEVGTLPANASPSIAVELEPNEIRRHPQKGTTPAASGAQQTGQKEPGPTGKSPSDESNTLLSAPKETLSMAYSCDPGSNSVWLAVENARFNASGTAVGSEEAKGNADSPKECICDCQSRKFPDGRACNAFSFDEKKRRCHFLHSNEADFPAPGSLARSGDDFSQSAFRRFCFPETFSAFNECAEFLAFTDYKLAIEPREIFDGLPSNAEGVSTCIELCVLANEFKCMSGLIDVQRGICRLYNAHSLSRPQSFQSHEEAGLLYFENGCAGTLQQPKEVTVNASPPPPTPVPLPPDSLNSSESSSFPSSSASESIHSNQPEQMPFPGTSRPIHSRPPLRFDRLFLEERSNQLKLVQMFCGLFALLLTVNCWPNRWAPFCVGYLWDFWQLFNAVCVHGFFLVGTAMLALAHLFSVPDAFYHYNFPLLEKFYTALALGMYALGSFFALANLARASFLLLWLFPVGATLAGFAAYLADFCTRFRRDREEGTKAQAGTAKGPAGLHQPQSYIT